MAEALAPTPPAAKPKAATATRLPATGTLMAGKRGLIMGVANDHSIAWGIARAAAAEGAELAFTYQSDLFAKRVAPLAESVDAVTLVQCDVAEPASARISTSRWMPCGFPSRASRSFSRIATP